MSFTSAGLAVLGFKPRSVMSRLLAPVVVLRSPAAILATMRTSGEGLLRQDWWYFTQRASRSSCRLEWGLDSHCTMYVWVALLRPHTSFTVVFQQRPTCSASRLLSRQSIPP